MRSTLLSFDGRVMRVTSLALFGAACLAACDTDRPTEPTRPSLPTTASAIVRPSGLGALTWRATWTNNTLLSGAQFKVVGPFKSTWIVTDNGANDADPTPGKFKLGSLKPGTYQACEIRPPQDYALPLPSLMCASGDVAANSSTDIGAFVSEHLPWLFTGYADIASNYIGGGNFTIRDSLGATVMTVDDNGSLDRDATDGKVSIVLPSAGKFSLCRNNPPPGYVFPVGQGGSCNTLTFANGTLTTSGPFLVSLPVSAYWAVVSGFINDTPLYIGPSTFKVTSADSSFSMDVVDNAANDMDLAMGKFLVKLPAAGDYTVCEITPVPGHFNANPACHSITVLVNKPALADYFVNAEQQVYVP